MRRDASRACQGAGEGCGTFFDVWVLVGGKIENCAEWNKTNGAVDIPCYIIH